MSEREFYFIDRMGCGSSFDASDGPRTVVVFGSTGLLGGAIARRLLQEPFLYKVRCVTRRSSGEKARELAEHGMRLFLEVFRCEEIYWNLIHHHSTSSERLLSYFLEFSLEIDAFKNVTL